MDPVQNLSIKIDKVSMNPVHDSIRTPAPCFVLTRSKWLPSHTKFFAEFFFFSISTLHVNLAAWQIFHGGFFSDGN